MLIPSKHERLEKNLLVIGGDIISILKKKPYNLENLFQELKKIKSININQYYNAITFLWLSEIIQIDEYNIALKK